MVKSTHKKEVSIFIADLEPAVKYDRTRAEAQKKPKGYLNRYYPTMKHNEKQFNCTVATQPDRLIIGLCPANMGEDTCKRGGPNLGLPTNSLLLPTHIIKYSRAWHD